MMSHPNHMRLAWRVDHVARFNTRWSCVKWRSVATPITHKAADTGHAPGVRITPKRLRCACRETRAAPSGGQGAYTRMIVSGRGAMGCPPSSA